MRLIRTDPSTEALEVARSDLLAVERVSSDDDVTSAGLEVSRAIDACGGDGSYQDRLEDGIRHADRCIDYLEAYGERARALHAAGQLRASNETIGFVLLRLKHAVEHVDEWLQYARHELEHLD